jgi:hypothetical protein
VKKEERRQLNPIWADRLLSTLFIAPFFAMEAKKDGQSRRQA